VSFFAKAACEAKLRHYTKAVADIDRYITEGGAMLSDADRAEAKALRDTIQGFTAPITIKCNEAEAEVLVDGEVVAKTPLATPIVADVGQRQIVVRKAGFKEFTQNLQLSGAASLDVQLQKEVHEGKLDVRAPDGAAIKVDGQAMGIGAWSGVLPSGGHTLNVSQAHMRTYQTEVVLQDGQTRTLEVTLEPEAKQGLPAWAWIAGGVVVAAGAAVGGYFIFHKSDTTAPTTAGTIQPGTVELPILR